MRLALSLGDSREEEAGSLWQMNETMEQLPFGRKGQVRLGEVFRQGKKV